MSNEGPDLANDVQSNLVSSPPLVQLEMFARGEVGKLTRGELTRFDCNCNGVTVETDLDLQAHYSLHPKSDGSSSVQHLRLSCLHFAASAAAPCSFSGALIILMSFLPANKRPYHYRG
jgi:hypothetical protein